MNQEVKIGDLVSVRIDSWQKIFLLDENRVPHKDFSRLIEDGELGTVLSITAPVMNETRYARVLLKDKIGYVRFHYLKKA